MKAEKCSDYVVLINYILYNKWAGHVARMGEERGCIGPWWETGGKETTGET